ncbi:hypothetical protein FBD94_23075 [Pedobacter hiemivivus]|uniref:Peptidase S74 domain-containing protein n=1 Tax=Pedobacter hiemivivus TaxID=2530454 RepID=A0A4U1FZT8_9SPHI|nr:hypothetical protein [Pedobacter hiemivivus]TKC56598.1 hypothetical protein FBD94_23075 [Pedobacter hiemivivus]
MKKALIIALVLVTCSIISKSQISPTLPANSKSYGSETYLGPDGLLWYGTAPLQYRGVYPKTKIDSLLALINNSISGNAATVTNGVVTTGLYADPAWITSLAYGKLTGTPTIPVDANLIHTTGNETKNGRLTLNSANGTNGTSPTASVSPLVVIGGRQGINTTTTGTVVGLNAPKISITGGNGGDLNTSTPSFNLAGKGADLEFTAGDGGNIIGAPTTPLFGAGGVAILKGGSSYSNGYAGSAQVKGGNNYTPGSARGGNVFIIPGAGNGTQTDNPLYNGTIYLNVTDQSSVRGNTVIGSITDDYINRFQVTGNSKLTGNLVVTGTVTAPTFLGNLTATTATVLTAPSGSTDVVRKTELDLKAPLESPALTGSPTSPTPTAGSNNELIATASFVTTAVTNALATGQTIGAGTTGNSATATNSTQWNGFTNAFADGVTENDITGIVGFHANGVAYKFSSTKLKEFIGSLGEETLQSVTDRGASTTNTIIIGNTTIGGSTSNLEGQSTNTIIRPSGSSGKTYFQDNAATVNWGNIDANGWNGSVVGNVTGYASKWVDGADFANSGFSTTPISIMASDGTYWRPWTGLGNYAPLESPALTGSPTSPTPTAGSNNERIATASFVTTAVNNALATGQTIGASIIGNAATATNSTQWNGFTNAFADGVTENDITGIVGFHANGVAYKFSSTKLKEFLGSPEEETLQSVTDRGASTTNTITIGNTTIGGSTSNLEGQSTNTIIRPSASSGKTYFQDNAATVNWGNIDANGWNGPVVGNVTGYASKWVDGADFANSGFSTTPVSIMASDGTYWRPWTGLSNYAPLASPALTGSPTAPTPTAGSNNERIATASFVTTAVTNALATGQTIGANTTGNSATATDAGKWNGLDRSNAILSTGYPLQGFYGDLGSGTAYRFDAAGIKEYLGIPSGGETLGTVAARGANALNSVSIRQTNSSDAYPTLGSFTGAIGLTNSDGGIYGLEAGVYSSSGSSWIQSNRFDGSPTAYNLLLQPKGGNVGIGTTSPKAKLDVNGSANISGTLTFNNTYMSADGLGSFDVNFNTGLAGPLRYFGGTTTPKFTVTSTGAGNFAGNVTAPTFNGNLTGNAATATNTTQWNGLSFVGAVAAPDLFMTGVNGNNSFGYSTTSQMRTALGSPSGGETLQSVTDRNAITTKPIVIGATSNNNWAGTFQNLGTTGAHGLYVNIGSNSTGVPFRVDKNSISQFEIFNNGNAFFGGDVGIGTTTPKEKLSVNGKIRAREVKVENTNWPDYVFTQSYRLPPLQETEKHIKEKGHLPGIPSAAEVKANGIDLGEMNAKLLQKIEELTLHLIEQNKIIETYNKKMIIQDERILNLEVVNNKQNQK